MTNEERIEELYNKISHANCVCANAQSNSQAKDALKVIEKCKKEINKLQGA